MYSLKTRLTRNLAISLLPVMLGLLVLLHVSMRQLGHDYTLTRLQHDAESMNTALEQDEEGRWRIDTDKLSAIYKRVRSGHYYRVQLGRQVLLSRTLVELMRRLYPQIEPGVSFQLQQDTLDIDRDDMLELIGNLVDNACKFARSRVEVLFRSAANRLEIQFDDDGQGVRDDQLQQILNRGVRLDEATEGHGLGLGICRDIVTAYGGNLSFAGSRLGGLRVKVIIPLGVNRDRID